MDAKVAWRLAANLVLMLHALFVLFVVVGLLLVFAGRAWRWSWVRNPWFRVTHLAAIAIVVLQSWLGILCPLTTLENALRERAGEASHEGGFIAHWIGRMLFYDAPAWLFMAAYTAFGALIVAAWFWVRPRPFSR